MRAALVLIMLLGCKTPSPPSLTSFSGTAMMIEYHVLAGNVRSKDDEQRIKTTLQKTFNEYDAVYNKCNPNSELSRFNKLTSTEPVPLSSDLCQLLVVADQIVKLTCGRFDPTIEPVQRLWKTALRDGHELDFAIIEALSPAIGWDKIHFNIKTLQKYHPLTELDLGGIARGYAVDLIFETLQKEGIEPLYVKWGSEIRVSKSHPSGGPWEIGITSPQDEEIAYILELSSEAVATSCDYEQFWTVPESSKIYFHIINPITLKPLERMPGRLASTTARAKTCVLADGVAKAGLFFDSKLEAEKWADSLEPNEIDFFFQEREICND